MLLWGCVVNPLLHLSAHNQAPIALQFQLCVTVHHSVILRDEPKPSALATEESRRPFPFTSFRVRVTYGVVNAYNFVISRVRVTYGVVNAYNFVISDPVFFNSSIVSCCSFLGLTCSNI